MQSNIPRNNQNRKRPSTLNLIFLAAVMGGLFMLLTWISQDISGEYTAFDQRLGVVTMTFVRRSSQVHCKIGVGTGAYLEADIPQMTPGQEARINYSLPEKWLKLGRPNRTAVFIGKVQDGTITGVVQDGRDSYPIHLNRDMFNSMRYVIQSYLPWFND